MSRQSPPPSNELGTSSSSAPPLTFSELLRTAKPGERDYSRLLLAVCGAMVVIAMSICGAVLVDRLRLPNLAIAEPREGDSGPRDGDALLRDILEGQRQAALWDPSHAESTRPADRGEPSTATKRPVDKPPSRRPSRSNSGDSPGGRSEETTNLDGVDPIYAALWGSGERYAALGRRAPSEAARAVVDAAEREVPTGLGTVLSARLSDRVAGTPVGAPVIAVLTRKHRFGELRLPAGTEAHGTVTGTGSDDTRLFLDFDFLLLKGGHVVPFRGVARDPQGRHGIPARRLLGRGAAGSIGLSSASRAAREVGRHLAGRVGDAVGAGLEGATESASEKSRRVDRDEHVLVAEAGAPLTIYVLGKG